jgi:hypothetical protein
VLVRLATVLALISLPGCYLAHSVGDGDPRADGGVPDGARSDGAPLDGMVRDGEVLTDGDLPDGTVVFPDVGPRDAAPDVLLPPDDAWVTDARVPPFDAWAPDAWSPPPDAWAPDAWSPPVDAWTPPADAWVPDAYVVDSGPPPSGHAISCGTATRVTVGHSAALVFPDVLTFEAWVRPRGPGVLAVKGDTGNIYDLYVALEADAAGALDLVAGWGTRAQHREIRVPFGDRLGRWTHVAYEQTVSGSTVHLALLLDGHTVATTDVPNDWAAANNSLEYHYCSLEGDMDDVRLWRVARTETAIQADMYRRLPGGITLLAAYWPLDEVGQAVFDASFHSADGVLGANSSVEPIDPTRIPDGAF